MRTECVPATPQAIERAGALIRQGRLVGFPTETVYGLGANALDAEAALGIFRAKERPADNPLIVHVSDMDQIPALIDGEMPEAARQLAQAFWPGPLTIVFKKSALVPDVVSGQLQTVGVRMPDNACALALIRASGVPIAAPSANRSGRPSPTSAAHVLLDMQGRIPMILDGGDCRVGIESTVLDVTCEPPSVLRPGGITPDMIARVVGEVTVDPRVLNPMGEGERPSSPGMKYLHYAPSGELSIVTGSGMAVASRISALYDEALRAGKTACILARSDRAALYGARRVRALGEDEQQAARALFAALREMDALGTDVILAEGFNACGLGLALMNRMLRAAAFRVIDVGDE